MNLIKDNKMLDQKFYDTLNYRIEKEKELEQINKNIFVTILPNSVELNVINKGLITIEEARKFATDIMKVCDKLEDIQKELKGE